MFARCFLLITFRTSDRSLLDILKKNKDATALAIACNDIGQYMKHVEQGRK